MKKFILGFVSGVAVSIIAKVIFDSFENEAYEDEDEEFDGDYEFSGTENEGDAIDAKTSDESDTE